MIHLSTDEPFVIYSMPQNQGFKLARLSQEKLEGKDQFIFLPFDGELNEGYFSVVNEQILRHWTFVPERPYFPEINSDQKSYLKMVEAAVKACSAPDYKIVLSRCEDFATARKVNTEATMLAWRTAFENALVYLVNIPHRGTWLGATPEILVKKRGKTASTMALAGTIWKDDSWTEKEQNEQGSVTNFIANSLEPFGQVTIGAPEVEAFGDIRHLKSAIEVETDVEASTLAEVLHPTPAICGFPKSLALSTIQKLEPYERSYYAGYLGFVRNSGDADLFVNLRCLQMFDSHVRFYAGGGINHLSVPEREWVETEKKIASTKRFLKLM